MQDVGISQLAIHSVGNGGYASTDATDGVRSFFLECVVWNEFVGYRTEAGKAPVCPRTSFLQNSESLRLRFSDKLTMRALGIDKLKDGTVELRCLRFHPVSGYRSSIKKMANGTYEFDREGVMKHYAGGKIHCARCAQLGLGSRGTDGYRDYRGFSVERVVEEDGTVWLNKKGRESSWQNA